MIRLIALLVLIMFAPSLSWAQASAGWRLESSDANSDTVKHDNGAQVKVIAQSVDKVVDDLDVLRLVTLPMNKNCPGIAQRTPEKMSNGRGVFVQIKTSLGQCIVGAGQGNGKAVMVMGMQSTREDVGIMKLVEFMVANRIDRNSTAQSLSSTLPAQVPQATGQAKAEGSEQQGAVAAPNATDLKSLIAAIPEANRPIGMAFRSEWDSVAMSMSYVPWVLFANNVAVEADCARWNPSVSPNVSNLTKIAPGCSVVRYVKRGDQIVFDKDDSISTGGFYGFKPGERITVAMGRRGGGSVGGAATTRVISSGQLRMNADGRIEVGAWTGATTTGSNFGAYSGSKSAVNGQYYLDGFLVAIQDQRGQTSIGFIAGKIEGRDRFMFLNGKQYWN